MNNELMHHGILGMRWGIRRTPEQLGRATARKKERADFRQKAANVAANKYAQGSDRQRARYASSTAAGRISKTAFSFLAQMVIADVMTGNISQYKNMNAAQITRKITSIAIKTAGLVALNDALAKSAMKNYTDKGTTVPGKKRSTKIVTKEDMIGMGVRVGVAAATVGASIGTHKLAQAARTRKANEARFNAWGQNILPQKTSEVVWSDGDKYSVINDWQGLPRNRGR